MSIYTVRTGVYESGVTAGYGRSLARDSTGRLWCCYYDYDRAYSYQIYCSYSDDNGETWTEEQVTEVTDWRDQYYPAIAIDSSDNVHLVWHATGYGANPGDSNILYQKRTGAGWQAVESVTDVAYYQGAASIAIDSNDEIHVVWHGLGWGSNPTDYNIQYRKRTITGWQDQEPITDKNDWNRRSAIAIDSNDEIHVAWEGRTWGGNPTYPNIQYRKRTGAGWQAVESVTDVAYDQGSPCITIDSSDDIHVVWSGKGWGSYPAEWNIQYRKRILTGWEDQEAVSDGLYQIHSSIAIDSEDNVHVVWAGRGYGSNPTKFNIQHRERTGDVWQDRVGITDRAYRNNNPGTLWALHPTVLGVKPNILETGFTFLWSGQDAGGYNVEFYASAPAIIVPTVTSDAATSVEATTTTLKGTLDDDGGEACDVRFQYGETSEYGINTEWQPDKESVVAFEQAITGLLPNTTYHFRAQAKNSAGTTSGADRTFTTLVATPTVTTNPATNVEAIAALVNGTLNQDGGEACDCGFEWGTDINYGITTLAQSKTTGQTFSQVIRGLFPGTTYHFRAFATNSAGISYGADRSFTTTPVMSRAYALAREEL